MGGEGIAGEDSMVFSTLLDAAQLSSEVGR